MNIYLMYTAVQKDLLPLTKLTAMMKELRDAGFTPFPGLIYVGGRLDGPMQIAGPAENWQESTVFYYKNDFKTSADKTKSIVSRYIRLSERSPEFAVKGIEGDEPRFTFVAQQSGLDCQIYVSSK